MFSVAHLHVNTVTSSLGCLWQDAACCSFSGFDCQCQGVPNEKQLLLARNRLSKSLGCKQVSAVATLLGIVMIAVVCP